MYYSIKATFFMKTNLKMYLHFLFPSIEDNVANMNADIAFVVKWFKEN